MIKHQKEIWLIGFGVLGLGILLFPLIQDCIYTIKTQRVNRELMAHSKGLNYSLGQTFYDGEIEKDPFIMKCMSNDWAAEEAFLPMSVPYSAEEEKREGVRSFGVRVVSESKPSLNRIVDMTLQGELFELYGIKKGTELEEAKTLLEQNGFREKYAGYGTVDGYWKEGIKILLFTREEKVETIELYIYNRKEYEAVMKVIKRKREGERKKKGEENNENEKEGTNKKETNGE